MRQGRESGFTLVELVVVIVLLGILAATALPRFMDVDDEAHASVVDGVMGSLQTGVAMYHAQWMAESQPATNTQIAEFANLRVNAAGYPYGTTNRSAGTSTVTDSSDCVAVFNGVLQAGAPSITGVANGGGQSWALPRTSRQSLTAPNCTFYYTGTGRRPRVPPSTTLTYSSDHGWHDHRHGNVALRPGAACGASSARRQVS